MVLEAPGRLVGRRLPIPVVTADSAIVRIEACGLCGTDHEQFSGALPSGGPFVPGHETVGVIERIGADASRQWGVRAGDRVAVEVFQSCGRCPPCRSGEYRRCVAHGMADMYGFIPVERAPGLWGGYATHQYLAPDSLVLPVPEGLDPVIATLFNPLGAGIRWGVTVPGTSAGDVVAVLGCGVRGLSAAVAAKEVGAGFVMVTGSGVGDASRLDMAVRFGADLTVDVEERDPVRALREATGGQADVVVDVTAKAPAAFGQAVALARVGATIVLAGTRGEPGTPGLHPDHIVYKELRILGALGVDKPAYEAALALLASGRYPWEELPRRVVDLNGLTDLLRAMSGQGREPPPMHGVVVP